MDWLSTFPTGSFSLRWPFQGGSCFFVSFFLASFLFLKCILYLVNRPFLDSPKNLLNECHQQGGLWIICTPSYSVSSFFSSGWCIHPPPPPPLPSICLPVPLTSGLGMGLSLANGMKTNRTYSTKPTHLVLPLPQKLSDWVSERKDKWNRTTAGLQVQYIMWVINAC